MLESSFKVNNSPAQNCMQEIVRLSAHGGNTCKMTFPGITPCPGSYYQKFLSILSWAWTAYLATHIVKQDIFCSKKITQPINILHCKCSEGNQMLFSYVLKDTIAKNKFVVFEQFLNSFSIVLNIILLGTQNWSWIKRKPWSLFCLHLLDKWLWQMVDLRNLLTFFYIEWESLCR